ncbi:MAG: hypothetical protein HQ575_03825 [Candidatus Omnitrophica bacterium]|nr:hypothetical protein [Candidatus Omnitrophota bacterium]
MGKQNEGNLTWRLLGLKEETEKMSLGIEDDKLNTILLIILDELRTLRYGIIAKTKRRRIAK